MKILVTGAAGRLGIQVVKSLVAAGHDVRAADLVPNADSPVKITIANILNRETCYHLCDEMDQVVHLANHINEHEGHPQRVYGENCQMNINVFQAAADCGVKRIVFSSSIQVVAGRRPVVAHQPNSQLAYLPLDSDSPANPGNSYALSKVASEGLLQYFANFKKISTVSIRFPGLFRSYLRMTHYQDGKDIHPWHTKHGTTGDEAMLFLLAEDAGRLVKDVCGTPDLPGFRIYLPSAPISFLYARSALDIYDTFYSNVPLRVGREQLTSLCDISRITREVGWAPTPWPSEQEIEEFKRTLDTDEL